jgi:hypothetical protein
VSPAVLQRQAALVGAALLAGLFVVVLDRSAKEASLPLQPPSGQAQWETAVVQVARLRSGTACKAGETEVAGVLHPVLPCGVKLEVSAHGRELRAEVVGRGPVAAGSDVALTHALAEQLGVRDGDRIGWRFAG